MNFFASYSLYSKRIIFKLHHAVLSKVVGSWWISAVYVCAP